jgi:hypothetical protein
LSNIFPCVFTLDLTTAISNTTFNSKGVRASPHLKPLLTLNSKDKHLPILTLPYISLFEVLHNLTNFLGKHSLCLSPFCIIYVMVKVKVMPAERPRRPTGVPGRLRLRIS